MAVKSVGTQQQAVSNFKLQAQKVRFNVTNHANGAGDQVVCPFGGLVIGNTEVCPLLGQGVVFGQLLDLALANPPDSTVPHMGAEGKFSGDENGFQGTAHAAGLASQCAGGIEHFVAGGPNGLDQQCTHFFEVFLCWSFLVGIENGRAIRDVLLNDIAGEGARDIATGTAPHSVCHDKKAQVTVEQIGILVVGANLAYIGSRPCLDPHSRLHLESSCSWDVISFEPSVGKHYRRDLKREKTTLVWIEGLVVGLFLAILLWHWGQKKDTLAFAPIDPAALATGPSAKQWFGVYFLEQKIGYAVTSRTPIEGGGELVHTEAAYTMAAAGQIARSVMASSAILDADRRLSQFDFFLVAPPVRLAARGEVQGKQLEIQIQQAGEVQNLSLPIDEAPHVGASVPAFIAQQETLREGQSFELAYFDPVSLSQQDMHLKVVGTEVLENGEEAYWFERDFGGATTRSLMLPTGETLREESTMGLSMVRESPEKARSMPATDGVVDVIALSAVRVDKRIGEPRSRKSLRLRVLGVEASDLAHEPPLQTVIGNEVQVRIPELGEIPALQRKNTDPVLAPFTENAPFLMVDHPEIQSTSKSVLGPDLDRKQAVAALNHWVFSHLKKAPTVGIPNALEVLRVGQGDCNEHTALFVALARAAGIPARTAAGLVYSDRVTGEGAFYYHAWPEVHFGPLGWVPVDPTFDQFPADATHIKVVDGGLDKQIAIMGIMGRLGFSLEKTPQEAPAPLEKVNP